MRTGLFITFHKFKFVLISGECPPVNQKSQKNNQAVFGLMIHIVIDVDGTRPQPIIGIVIVFPKSFSPVPEMAVKAQPTVEEP